MELDLAILKAGRTPQLDNARVLIETMLSVHPIDVELYLAHEFQRMDGQIPLQEDTEECEFIA